MAIKRIGEHVFTRKDESGFDITTMCGPDAMDHVFELFGMDVFDWCNHEVARGRPGQARILHILQCDTAYSLRDILHNWFRDKEYCDSKEFMDKFMAMLNSVTGADYFKLYGEILDATTDGDATQKKDESKS